MQAHRDSEQMPWPEHVGGQHDPGGAVGDWVGGKVVPVGGKVGERVGGIKGAAVGVDVALLPDGVLLGDGDAWASSPP